MKHTLFILALITASIQTFAQSPRIKLNQITKDSLTGSVLISSPTDSGMVYSRDLFISYGADTVLILGGDTLAATSGIISSVLSDGVTITGDGTTGSELTVDTATVIATKGDLTGYVDLTTTQTVGGAKTFSSTVTGTRFDPTSSNTTGNGMFLPTTNTLGFSTNGSERIRITDTGNVGIGTTTPKNKLDVEGGAVIGATYSGTNTAFTNGLLVEGNVGIGTTSPFYKLEVVSTGGGINLVGTNAFFRWNSGDMQIKNEGSFKMGFYTYNVTDAALNQNMVIDTDGNVGIGASSPSEALEVNGNILASGTITPNGSDRKLKTNIRTLSSGLDVISNLIPVTYDFIQNTDKKFPIYNQVGFVAQDVQDALSGKSYINGIVIETKDYLALDYDKFSPIIVKAIQEQQAIIESQATEIETLKSQIQLILSEIEQIKNN